MKVQDITYHEVTGVDDFQFVIHVQDGGGYDWNELAAWWSPSKRRFFWIEGAGCSCNYLGEDVYDIGGFVSGNREQLASAVRARGDEGYSGFSAGYIIDAIREVKTFKPTKIAAA